MNDALTNGEVSLRRVTAKTFWAINDLCVLESQRKFVAPNSSSIAQAYFCKNAWFRAIYAGETPVGFVMLYEAPKRGKYYLWRFMIDSKYQGKGFGTKALEIVIRRVEKNPKAKSLTLSILRAEGGPEAFYRQHGFEFTGKIKDGQHLMRLDFKKTPKPVKRLSLQRASAG